MMMLVQVVAAFLLVLGSGLIFYALLRLDRAAASVRPHLPETSEPRTPALGKLRRAA